MIINILVQLALDEHPANFKTVAPVRREAEGGETFVFPPLIATEFLHVVTEVRRFFPPDPVAIYHVMIRTDPRQDIFLSNEPT